jgi:signal transduction histidine kinase
MAADGQTQPQPQVPSSEELGRVLHEYMQVTTRLQHTHELLQGEVERLRREVAQKDRELELRRRLSALGELAAGVAHEVRNPLGAIRLYSDLLRTECGQHQLEPALELIGKIEAGIQAIDAVVQDTLALAPRDRAASSVELAELIARARDAALEVLTLREVRLEVRLAGDELVVQGDANGLQRVLVNLIVNAAEVSQPQQAVRVDAEVGADDMVVVRVADDGPGIPADVRDRIFDPFFTTKDRGTGLGLTIAHRLIEAYGGTLQADNRESGGAQFTMTLPRASQDRAQDGPQADAQQHSAA